MSYTEAQEVLLDSFKNLAQAYNNFIKEGGKVDLEIYRQELLLKIQDGVTIGFVLSDTDS